MDLDSILPVENMSDITIQTLVDRNLRSTRAEHFIYREVELDELWRLVDIAVRTGHSDEQRSPERLINMRAAIHRAHDLIGMDSKPIEAAAALREALG